MARTTSPSPAPAPSTGAGSSRPAASTCSRPDELATLTLLLGRLGRLNELIAGEVCQAHGVTAAEVRVLAVLREADGPVRPGVLSERVVQTSGGLTATLRRLEGDGRVHRVDDPDDGRVRAVALTGEGEAFVDDVVGALLERYEGALGDLDVAATLGAVRHLLDRLEADTGSRLTGAWRYGDAEHR